jgi:hypothetical protein
MPIIIEEYIMCKLDTLCKLEKISNQSHKIFIFFNVKPQVFIETPNHCTIAIVPGSVAIAYRTSHR